MKEKTMDRPIQSIVEDCKQAAAHYGTPHEDGPHPALARLLYEAAEALEEARADLLADDEEATW